MKTLLLGTSASRLIGFASTPVLTRIYTPEDYGVLTIFTAFVMMLMPIVTLRYSATIPLPRRDGMAINLLVLSATLMFTTTLMLGAGLWAFGTTILPLFSMEALVPYWWLIILGIVGTGSYEVLSMWAIRCKAYPIIAKTQVLQTAIGALSKISLGLLALKPIGLLIGQIITQSGGIGSFIRRYRLDFRQLLTMISLRRIAFLARYYNGFPIYRLPAQFLLVFSTQAPLLFVSMIYDAETTGQLGLALMALALPISLIGQSIGQAYYAEAAALSSKQPKKILEITKSVQKGLFTLGIPPTIVIFLFGRIFFELLFGEAWSTAGSFASVMSVYLLLQMTSAPLVQVLNVFNMQRIYLIINTVRALALLALFLVFNFIKLSAGYFVFAYSVLMTLFYFAMSLLILRFLLLQVQLSQMPRINRPQQALITQDE